MTGSEHELETPPEGDRVTVAPPTLVRLLARVAGEGGVLVLDTDVVDRHAQGPVRWFLGAADVVAAQLWIAHSGETRIAELAAQATQQPGAQRRFDEWEDPLAAIRAGHLTHPRLRKPELCRRAPGHDLCVLHVVGVADFVYRPIVAVTQAELDDPGFSEATADRVRRFPGAGAARIVADIREPGQMDADEENLGCDRCERVAGAEWPDGSRTCFPHTNDPMCAGQRPLRVWHPNRRRWFPIRGPQRDLMVRGSTEYPDLAPPRPVEQCSCERPGWILTEFTLSGHLGLSCTCGSCIDPVDTWPGSYWSVDGIQLLDPDEPSRSGGTHWFPHT